MQIQGNSDEDPRARFARAAYLIPAKYSVVASQVA